MATAAAKIAISIPSDLLRAVEDERRRAKLSRSAVIQQALRRWFRERREAASIRQYEEGYRRAPERQAEIRMHEALAAQAMSLEEWG